MNKLLSEFISESITMAFSLLTTPLYYTRKEKWYNVLFQKTRWWGLCEKWKEVWVLTHKWYQASFESNDINSIYPKVCYEG